MAFSVCSCITNTKEVNDIISKNKNNVKKSFAKNMPIVAPSVKSKNKLYLSLFFAFAKYDFENIVVTNHMPAVNITNIVRKPPLAKEIPFPQILAYVYT